MGRPDTWTQTRLLAGEDRRGHWVQSWKAKPVLPASFMGSVCMRGSSSLGDPLKMVVFLLASLQTPQQTDALKTEGTPIVHLMSQLKCSEISKQKDDKDQSDQSFALVSPPEIGGLKTRKNWANVMSPGVPVMAGNKVFLCTPRVNAQKAKKSGVAQLLSSCGACFQVWTGTLRHEVEPCRVDGLLTSRCETG